MKTEHEKLKEICDVIGIEDSFFEKRNIEYDEDGFYNAETHINYNVREIIFTQEFMDLYINKLKDKVGTYFVAYKRMNNILGALDNPVEFLYNTLELGKQI